MKLATLKLEQKDGRIGSSSEFMMELLCSLTGHYVIPAADFPGLKEKAERLGYTVELTVKG